jgi:hypothetical protein
MDYLYKKNNTSYIKTFAILLIINSHLDLLYSSSIFASGGAIGNSIFFLLSGYGLKFSYDSNPQKFSIWIRKRLFPLFISVWFINLIFIVLHLTGVRVIQNFFSFGLSFIYTDYWFINALIIYYLLGFYFLKIKSLKILQLLAFAFFIYLLVYSFIFNVHDSFIVELMPYKVFFYFFIFIIGIYIKIQLGSTSYPKVQIILFFLVSLTIYLYIKLFQKDSILFKELQIVQQILQAFIVSSLLILNVQLKLWRLFDKNNFIKKTIALISNVTLEIYLTHSIIIGFFLNQDYNPFITFFGIYFITIFISIILKILTTKILK